MATRVYGLLLVLVIWTGQRATSAMEFTEGGLEIHWVHACEQVDVECPYNHTVEILSKFDGVKTEECPTKNPECCTLNTTTDCYVSTSDALMRVQRFFCENRTRCPITYPGGYDIGCGITRFVAVSYVCSPGGPTTPAPTPSTNLPDIPVRAQLPELHPAAIAAPIAIVFVLFVFILCGIYFRFYRSKRDLQRARGPPPVTYLRSRITRTLARMRTAPRFKMDSGLKGTTSSLYGSQWSKDALNYQRLGGGPLVYPVSKPNAKSGNLWKQANWMTSINNNNNTGHLYRKRGNDKARRARVLMAEKDRDMDSLDFGDDLDFPDISIFNVPETRHSPDSGLDNLGYILPVLPDSSAHNPTPPHTPPPESDMRNDEVVLAVPRAIRPGDGEALDNFQWLRGTASNRPRYDSGIISDHLPDRHSGISQNNSSHFRPYQHQFGVPPADTSDTFSNLSSTVTSDMLF